MFSRFMNLARISRFQQQTLGYILTGTRKKCTGRGKRQAITSVPFVVGTIWGLSKSKDDNKSITTKEILLSKADALFDQEEYKEIYRLLNSYNDNKDVEILWRLSRALYKMSKLESNKDEAKRLIYEAYNFICKALNLKDDHWAVHKWVAILLNSKTSYEGTKIKIQELYNIKKHMLKAIELNPKDATTLYMIGSWCYQVADLAWYQRKIATAIFSEPPISSFEEALDFFERAEQVDPNFYGHNLLMLGKTYLKLNKKEEALKYLKMAAEYPVKNDDDQEAKQEALKILSGL